APARTAGRCPSSEHTDAPNRWLARVLVQRPQLFPVGPGWRELELCALRGGVGAGVELGGLDAELAESRRAGARRQRERDVSGVAAHRRAEPLVPGGEAAAEGGQRPRE